MTLALASFFAKNLSAVLVATYLTVCFVWLLSSFTVTLPLVLELLLFFRKLRNGLLDLRAEIVPVSSMKV